ncbi:MULTISPECIES: PrgH/EprH family type III secretion apparatus protein [unclassified Undibacterium]|uniref:PrgH/EprH family type III secretion apparatus protein n=1 Tax=unclassified Undibacterium TaxID=2630295 RepID=UPI002AC99F59|nr:MULTISPECIES: PrgH/EprH family type III secretion apparatus protein [unclassified Undibacterium]MEB0140398.1 PrgH/EprH family type III secretion apparatus protein [Undibacterium sp. CCC2.1]MEB0173432.1 PrgH/EprH family type III secretion apparatus protein [Undibacterium sp. CCC1.1]MEB0177332.1 PrgH/EprH family type III secretion apparatus protein [Undibacterium sp. CCC3.4]MEB0216589.1 PrgH/EprH family type III secretion apparatus protein [Undibacterium sp. 5I2]WPX43491.1 PrgH/EprH family ty
MPLIDNNHIEPSLYPSTDEQEIAVLKILNGPMRGAEFKLLIGTTFFVVGNTEVFDDTVQFPSFPDNAIFIPIDGDGFNFEVVIDSGSEVVLRELRDDQVTEQHCPLNTVVRLGLLDLSVRSLADTWDPAVLNHPLVPEPLDEPIAAVVPGKTPVALIAGVSVFLLCAVVGAGLWLNGNEQREQLRLNDILKGSVGNYQIVKGDSEVFYVFAENLRDATWARQALVRNDLQTPAAVVHTFSEKQRVEAALNSDASFSAYHLLNLDDPVRPELFISAERGPRDTAGREQLSRHVATLLPYASTVKVTALSDAAIANEAQNGLDQLGIPYQRVNRPASVTFVMRPSLNDIDLQKLRPYVEAFYQHRGVRYVHFVVDLKDDWLKGKSFGYGTDSYVKLTPSHWYFSPMISSTPQ